MIARRHRSTWVCFHNVGIRIYNTTAGSAVKYLAREKDISCTQLSDCSVFYVGIFDWLKILGRHFWEKTSEKLAVDADVVSLRFFVKTDQKVLCRACFIA